MLCSGCYPGYIVPAKVEVFAHSRSEQLLEPGHLAVFPFYSTAVPNETCRSVALKFSQEINKLRLYTKITVPDNSPCSNRLDNRDRIQKEAVLSAGAIHADLALVGFIDSYMPGTATDSNVSLSVMIVDVSHGTTLWWGADRLTGKPGKTFLLWDSSLSPDSPAVNKLLNRSVGRIVKKIYGDYTRIKRPGMFDRFRDLIFSFHKNADRTPEPPSNNSAGVLPSDNETLQQGPTTQTEPEPKQILDSAINDIDTFGN